MVCTPVKAEDGTVMICFHGRSRSRPVKLCYFCDKPSTKLCDFKWKHSQITKGVQHQVTSTCNRPLCDNHAVEVGHDIDYCHTHPSLAQQPPPQLVLL